MVKSVRPLIIELPNYYWGSNVPQFGQREVRAVTTKPHFGQERG
jgi:hypothetical protein